MARMSWDEAFSHRYDEWGGGDDRRHRFYVGLVERRTGPLVELAVGNGRVAIPVARATGRRVIGIDTSPAMLEQARERATDAAVDLELHLADMRDLRSTSRRRSIYCPFRALLHLPTWADRRASSSGSRRVAPTRRAVRLERVRASTIRDRDTARRRPPGEPVPHTVRYAVGTNRIDIDLDGRLSQLALVGDEERVARPHRRRRPRARGARTAGSQASRSTTPARVRVRARR
jgi:SAM-dependent methyltransferase